MRQTTMISILALTLGLAACDSGGPRSNPSGPGAMAAIQADGAFVEQHPDAMLAWDVAPDGKTKLIVRSGTCEPLTSGVTGVVDYIGVAGGKTASQALTLDKAQGTFTAPGMALDKEATELRYSLTIKGKPLEGALHLPAGGTKALLATADESKAIEDDATGPNGGTLLVVDGTRYEVAADEQSGEVRVYALTAKGDVSETRPEAIRLMVGGSKSMVIDLVARTGNEEAEAAKPAEPEAAEGEAGAGGTPAPVADEPKGKPHFAGRAAKGALSKKLTIAVRNKGKTKLAVVGHRRGRALALGHANLKQRHWSRHGWTGVGLKLGHRLEGPPVRAKQGAGSPGKGQGKAKGHDKDKAQGKAKGHDKDKGPDKGKGPAEGKAKGKDKDKAEGKAKGHDKDPAEGKAKGHDKDPGAGKGQGGPPAQPPKGKGKGSK